MMVPICEIFHLLESDVRDDVWTTESNRENLRDLIVAFEAHRDKQYHLKLGREPIAKTTLTTASQNSDYRIF